MSPKHFGQERGAVLVHVAFALLALLAFSVFVFDYGVMWVSRRQAQNAADSGAHAGAVALSFDGFNNRTDSGPAKLSAINTANKNAIWGDQVAITAANVSFPACPDGTNGCIRVDVYRDGTNGSTALPLLFGSLVGITSNGTRATATAKVMASNATNCLKPWAVIDKWHERTPKDMTPDEFDDNIDKITFDKYDKKGNIIPGVTDEYAAPTDTDFG